MFNNYSSSYIPVNVDNEYTRLDEKINNFNLLNDSELIRLCSKYLEYFLHQHLIGNQLYIKVFNKYKFINDMTTSLAKKYDKGMCLNIHEVINLNTIYFPMFRSVFIQYIEAMKNSEIQLMDTYKSALDTFGALFSIINNDLAIKINAATHLDMVDYSVLYISSAIRSSGDYNTSVNNVVEAGIILLENNMITEQNLCTIFEELFQHMSPLFMAVMLDTRFAEKEYQNNIITKIILTLLENMTTNNIYKVLHDYRNNYNLLYMGKPVRINMNDISYYKYPRIFAVVNDMKSNNIYLPK